MLTIHINHTKSNSTDGEGLRVLRDEIDTIIDKKQEKLRALALLETIIHYLA